MMVTMSSSALAEYTEALKKVSSAAAMAFQAACHEMLLRDYGTADIASLSKEQREELRDKMCALAEEIQNAYGQASAVLGGQFFEAVTEAHGRMLEATTTYEANHQQTRTAMGRAASGLFRAVPLWAQVMKAASAFIEDSVYHAADEAVAHSAQIHASKEEGLRFARVPQGKTCDWCLMLASRGFGYITAQSAGDLKRYHKKCDCRIVPGYAGVTKVEGYDDLDLYHQWKDSVAKKATERAERNGTTVEEEREKIMRQYGEAAKRANAKHAGKYAASNGELQFATFDDVKQYIYAASGKQDLAHRSTSRYAN